MSQIIRGYLFFLIFFFINLNVFGQEFNVGIGRKIITPELGNIWMGGYASRNKPATGTSQELWAKALVIEDSDGNHCIIVTTDLLGLSHQLSEEVSARVIEKHRIQRSQLLLNSSHDHSGPVILPSYFDFSVSELQSVNKYSQKLADDLVEIIDMAWNDLKPVNISSGHGNASFGKNRRDPSLKIRPVDPDVPVLAFKSSNGDLKAILFGYACHNTTLSGDNYEFSGDYAGFAQIELEKRFHGTTAMFFQGCGADIDPSPRGTMIYAEQHGKSLAGEVQKVLSGDLQKVNSPIRTGYKIINLDFNPVDPESYKKDMLSQDRFIQRRARMMFEAINKGWDISKIQYPVQAIRFNDDLTFLGMGGEVVVDYSLLVKKEFPRENMFIAGYCNEVMCYIPTRRILHEGGYEGNSSMIYKGLPGPFAENVEEKVLDVVREVLKEVGVDHN